jgi:predicted nucleic acid-binding protein
MTRFAIDAPVALRLVRERLTVPGEHQLVGPTVLRSQALAGLYAEVRRGEMSRREGRSLLDGIARMKIRLLGDRVSRVTAWRIAEQLDWDDIGRAEYLAVAQLQADALVTLDPGLVAAASGLVPVVEFGALLAGPA